MKKSSINWQRKTILLTGGTGSFGQAFTKYALAKLKPKVLRIFSRDELKQDQMQQKFGQFSNLRLFIGDVRDRRRLFRAMDNVNIVIHAAALKQIPALEYNPYEAVRTNIEGTQNVIDAAIAKNISKALFISSDKACYPVNLYGATKLCAEKLFSQANAYVGRKKTRFACVRYGNVLASRGSVVPLFKKQKKQGCLTLTDKRMTRFWITLKQGVKFVILALGKMEGGEIFVPKIPSLKIIDLAKTIAPRVKKKFIGRRPGEKLHETLITHEEATRTFEFKKYFIIEPQFIFWKRKAHRGRKKLNEKFCYSSNTNKFWFTQKQIFKLI